MRELWLEMWHDIHPDAKLELVKKAGPLRDGDCYLDYGKARCGAWSDYYEYSYRLRYTNAEVLSHYL
ncbi:hypothetical protein PHAVU_008G143913, partial [Phaseolus vulgaris]